MDTNVTIAAEAEAEELDMAGYPAEQGRSLVDVAAAGMTSRFSRCKGATLGRDPEPSLVGMVAVGLALGAMLGLVLT